MIAENKDIDILATSHLPIEEQPKIDYSVQESQDKEPTEEQSYNKPQEIKEPENEPEYVQESEESQNNDIGDKQDNQNYDDYGNERTQNEPKTYTQEEVNEMFRRRFKNNPDALPEHLQPKNQQQSQQSPPHPQNQQAEAEGDWQKELKEFVRSTFQEDQQQAIQREQLEREQQAQHEFEMKLRQGIDKYNDFREVVEKQPITDAMTIATRAMKDPAAFLYAASKQQPQELERISKIVDPYTQIVEIGRLEERMRKKPVTSNTPKPVSRVSEDATYKGAEPKKVATIEDMIHAERKRRSRL